MWILKLINRFIRITLKGCKAVALITITGMCLVAVLQVASRVLPGLDPFSWTEEASLFLMVFMTFAVLPIASYRNLHTLLDMLLERLGALKFPTEVFITLLCLATSVACTWFGWLFYKSGAGTMATTLNWVDRGWVYFAIPLSFALMATVYLQHLITMFVRKRLVKRGDDQNLRLFDAAIRIDHL
jgi:TRAP-type C4-dicarboxylate transport system permease small subunit